MTAEILFLRTGQWLSIHPSYCIKMTLKASQKFTGYTVAILSGMLFGLNPFLRLVARNAGMSASGVMLVSMLMGSLISFVVYWIRRDRIRTKCILKLIFAGAIGAGLTGYFLLSSYSYISSGSTQVIHFLYPTFICLANVILFHRRFTFAKAAAIILSIAGVYLISDFSTVGSIRGVLLALLSALTFAAYSLLLDGDQDISGLPAPVKIPFLLLGGAAVSFLICLLSGNLKAVPASLNTVSLLGCFGSSLIVLFATLFFAMGIRMIGSSPTGFCSLFEPITSVIVGIMLRAEPITVRILIGMILALSTVVVIISEDWIPAGQKPASDR